jgi:hypothetical protein
MTTTTTSTSTSTAIVATRPLLSNAERLALAGFLVGYTGLTREAYALDLRQFTTCCQQHDLRLLEARRGRHRVLRPGLESPRPG